MRGLLAAATIALLTACGGSASPGSGTPSGSGGPSPGGPAIEEEADEHPSAIGSSGDSARVRRAAPDSARIEVLVFGNSITAGSGVESYQAFPARLRQKVDSLGWPVRIIEAGVSGETTSGGLRRIGAVMDPGVDVLLLELGGNDGLRGTDPELIRSNLRRIIDRARSVNPDLRVLLVGIRMPPNMGPRYTEQFARVYRDLARENDLVLVPRLLEGVGGREAFMQGDGIHPNPRGHRRVAATLWAELRPMLVELVGVDREVTAASS